MGADELMTRMVQIGTVTSLDVAKRRARVKFQDTGITSGWLYVLQHYDANLHIEPNGEHSHNGIAGTEPDHDHTRSHVTYWMPKINDTVVVLYVPVMNGDGFILGGI